MSFIIQDFPIDKTNYFTFFVFLVVINAFNF